MNTPLFVTAEWLNAHLFDANVRIVDGSWHMPNANRDAAKEFEAAHIPGAVFFDIDRIADKSTDLPHMIAKPDEFSAAIGALGISETDTIIIYDSVGLFTAPRVWWNFKVMGASDVRILEGGLPQWIAEEKPLAQGPALPEFALFQPRFAADHVKSAADVLEALNGDAAQVVDVRGADRFAGRVEEPRPGLRSGHMPGAFNLPFPDLIANGRLKPSSELRAIIAAHGIDPDKPVVTSCGSGVTATILNLALTSLGYDQMRAYDGSWAEWGGRADLPVVRD
jgi:thiosulfate/3-mercaptopyruvate sulfurtransferase